MSGLINEIQRDVLNEDVPIDRLLRKVKLAAAKLELTSLEAWIEQELNGYNGELPPYRKAAGEPAAWNHFNGWVPVLCADTEINELIHAADIRQSISSLQDLMKNMSNDILHLPIPPWIVELANNSPGFKTSRMVIQISRGSIATIISAVRNKVLDWAIEMERKGVLGEGMSFDQKEKVQAKEAMTNFHIGSIGNFVGNMGVGNSSRDIIVPKDALCEIRDVIDKIKSSQADLIEGGVDKNTLLPKISEIEAAIANDKPEKSRLKRLLEDMRAILTGAAGNLTAEGATAMITKITGLLG